MSSRIGLTDQRPQPTSLPTHRQPRVPARVPLSNARKQNSIFRAPRSAIRSLLSRYEWAVELLLEFRNFLYRSSILLRLRTVALADLGPHAGRDSSGHLILCSRTRGRIQDLQKFRESRKWASREDFEIFLTGWNAGAAWSEHNEHLCCPQPGIPGTGIAVEPELPCMRPPSAEKRWRDATYSRGPKTKAKNTTALMKLTAMIRRAIMGKSGRVAKGSR